MKRSFIRELIQDITRSKFSRKRMLYDGLFIGVLLFLFLIFSIIGE